MNVTKAVISALVLSAIAGGIYVATRSTTPVETSDRRQGRSGSGGPASVLAEPARQADVPVYLDGVGSAKARNTVTVKPQVDGRLLSINFKEGQDVKKGDLLAKIDPVTYQAQLDQALAKKALDEALVANSRRDLTRFEKVGTLAISQQQIDTQRALIAQQEAQIKSDDASIENLTAILGYTTITSPIDGRTGIRLVDEGNLLRAGDATGIVVITEVKPISVVFTLPQQNLPTLSKAAAGGVLKAEAYTTDGHALLDNGELQVVDNQVDPTTGTVKLKADFPNDKLQLWPGQFVNIRLLVDTMKGVVVASASAVQRGPNGTFVYVLGSDETVSMRPVKVAQQDEKDAVISEGLKVGESVVTSGFGRLEDGTKVKVSGDRAPDANTPTNGTPGASAAPPRSSDASIDKAEATTGGSSLTTGTTTAAEAAPVTTSDDTPAETKTERRHRRHKDSSGAAP